MSEIVRRRIRYYLACSEEHGPPAPEETAHPWWDVMTEEEQKAYIKRHPNTHMIQRRAAMPPLDTPLSREEKQQLQIAVKSAGKRLHILRREPHAEVEIGGKPYKVPRSVLPTVLKYKDDEAVAGLMEDARKYGIKNRILNNGKLIAGGAVAIGAFLYNVVGPDDLLDMTLSILTMI